MTDSYRHSNLYLAALVLASCLALFPASTAAGTASAPGTLVNPTGTVVRLSELNIDQVDELLESRRRLFARIPQDPDLRFQLSALLLRKAVLLKGRPFAEIEACFQEASDFSPDSFDVPYQWGQALFASGNFEAAIPKYETALSHRPEHLDSLMKLGISQMKMMKYEDALALFEKAQKQIPNDYLLLYFLGRCCFELKDFDRAIEIWEKALEHAPNGQETDALRALIARAREQSASISGTTTDENQRFVIHYAGSSQKDIGDVTLEVLEDVYDQVTSDLMYKPDVKINVIFFLTEEFYELNNSARWVGALARGEKILVPLQQGYSDLQSVKGILAHEFTHVIVNLRTNNRCPTWINEGLAVYEEFKFANGDPTNLRSDYEKLYQTKILNERHFIPLKEINLNPQQQTYGYQIGLGYLQSYLAMRFLIERWGWSGVDGLLGSLGKGEWLDEALDEAAGMDFPQFQKELNDWMLGL
ncbi:MAG TPA: tetratricopeptide repeat protein [Candidatus Ozemobacteraceae bacterium]|nr:tetratricopeptide repeat protein [Candidatus Ozemobacteraceae bacterium]